MISLICLVIKQLVIEILSYVVCVVSISIRLWRVLVLFLSLLTCRSTKSIEIPTHYNNVNIPSSLIVNFQSMIAFSQYDLEKESSYLATPYVSKLDQPPVQPEPGVVLSSYGWPQTVKDANREIVDASSI